MSRARTVDDRNEPVVDRTTLGSRRDLRDAAVLSALLLGVLLLHSLLAPTYRGPDEPHHFDLAREWSLDADYDVISRQISTQIMASLAIVDFGDGSRHLEQGEAPPRGERPRLDELGPDEASSSYNQISQHGPTYPVVVGTGLAAIDAVDPGPRWAFDRVVGVARLLSIAMVAPVAGIVFTTMRVLGGSRFEAWLAGLVPLGIPQFTHINSMVNNDALLVLVGASLALGTAVLIRSGPRRTTLITLGVVCGVGLMTKALVIGPLVGVAAGLVLTWVRRRPERRDLGLQLCVLAVATIGGGGWWMVRNIVEYSTPQPTGPALLPPAPESFEPDVWEWFNAYRNTIPRTAFGQFGWLELPIGWGWVRAAIAVAVVAFVLAVVRTLRSRPIPSPLTWTELTVFVAPAAILAVLVASETYQGYVTTGRFPGLQGRYFFGVLPFLALVVAVGVGAVRQRFRLLVGLGALCWIVAVQWKAATVMLGFYWGPPGGTLRDQIAAVLAWSPWPIGVSLLFGAVAVAAGVATTAVGVVAATEPATAEVAQSGS